MRTENDRVKAKAIAQDVLDRLSLVDYTPGIYFLAYIDSLPEGCSDLRGVADQLERCRACALGGLLLSKACLYDAVPLSRMTDPMDNKQMCLSAGQEFIVESLDEAFSREQLDMIESAFEGIRVGCNASDEMKDKAKRFARVALSMRARVQAIMENIISSEGVFVP